MYPDVCSKGVIYLDTWPISPPMLSVSHPDIMSQFTVDNSRLKHEHLREEFHSYTSNLDLVTSDGQQWKAWRSIFNPGFSAKNLIRLVPDMLEEVSVFRDWLQTAAASGEVVPLVRKSEEVTIDIISRTVL